MVEKYIKDGKVAVVYSPGYGSGWSTWADEDVREWCLFDKRVVELVLNDQRDKVEALVEQVWGDEAYVYCGFNINDLAVHWLDPGTRFRVHEYDGSETIETFDNIQLYTA